MAEVTMLDKWRGLVTMSLRHRPIHQPTRAVIRASFVALGVFMLVRASVTLASPSVAARQPQVAQTRDWTATSGGPLKVTLTADRYVLPIGSDVTVRVLLTNTAASTIYLYGSLDWGEGSSLSLWLRDDATGREVSEILIPDDVPPPPTSASAFVRLMPGYTYGVSLRCRLSDLNIVKPITGRPSMYSRSDEPVG